ncbi:ciliary microtubule associated protein 1A-like isoform X2 [Artemia franciscana]|uniref:ciliary microtubule associated protein 1A-like isoform X2 n=1 Tax=Artemia franciscana TaxID=6661 RepID=UPI0032DAD1FF
MSRRSSSETSKSSMGSGTQGNYTPTKRRGPIAAEFQTPGPATIVLPSSIGINIQESTIKKAPAFSFGSKPEDKLESPGPGPGQYNVTKLTYKGKDEHPAPTIAGRPKDPKKDLTPAPGTYCPEKGEKVIGEHTPAYSFGTKLKIEKPDNIPAPNSYSIPPAIGVAPAYTISGKGKTQPPPMLPGPGQYDSSSPDKIKPKSPAYSLSSRTHLPSDSTQKPGPGAHSPEKVHLEGGKRYSFGVKHSPYLGSLKAH